MSISHQQHPWQALLVLVAIATVQVRAGQFTARWVGPVSGKWSDSGNWQFTPAAAAGTIPNNTASDVFDVVCEFSGTIAYDVPVSIRNLTLSAPPGNVVTLLGDPDLTITGDLTWKNGRMEGTGVTSVTGGATLQNEHPSSPEGGLYGRTLSVKGATTLSSAFGLGTGAKIINEQSGTFHLAPGASFQSDASDFAVHFVNRGHFSSDPNMTVELPRFQNENRIDISANSSFKCGNGFAQESGKVRLDGGTFDTQGLEIFINGGEISGFGTNLGTLTVNGTLSPSPRTLTVSDTLYMGANATCTFAIGGPNGSAEYDNLTVGHGMLLGGMLEVHFANGFERLVDATNDFLIIRVPSLGVEGFSNVAFEDRIFTSDGYGSFLLERDLDGIHLRNFQKTGTLLNFSTALAVYTFSPAQLLLDPQADLFSPAPKWPGGGLKLEFVSGSDAAKDSFGIQTSGEGPAQIAADPWIAGASQVRFGGLEFGILRLDSTTGRLECLFEPNATTEAVQALVRSLFFTTRDFNFDLFVNGPIHPPDRTVRLTLADSAGFNAAFDKRIELPDLKDVFWRPAYAAIDFGKSADLKLAARFVYPNTQDFEVETFAVSPFHFSDDCIASTITVTGPGQIHVEANASLESDTCIVSFHAGDVTGDAHIRIGSDCSAGYLAVLAYFFDISAPPPPPRPIHELNVSSASTNFPLISLPIFHTFEKLLSHTPEGQRLAALYWQHTAEVVSILKTNLPLATASVRLFLNFQPAVSALLAGKSAGFQITQPMIDQLNSVWDPLAATGSSALKTDLIRERERFHGFQDFVGKDFSKWAGLLQIEAPAQPLLFVSSSALLDGQFRIEANSLPGMTFSLWRFSVPGNWQQVSDVRVEDDGYTVSMRDPHPTPSRSLYQVRASATP